MSDKWIKLSDRLPAPFQPMFLANAKENRVYASDGGTATPYTLTSNWTHWMPLERPEPPKMPRDIWINQYEDGSFGKVWREKDSAEQAVELIKTRAAIVHFREVID